MQFYSKKMKNYFLNTSLILKMLFFVTLSKRNKSCVKVSKIDISLIHFMLNKYLLLDIFKERTYLNVC